MAEGKKRKRPSTAAARASDAKPPTSPDVEALVHDTMALAHEVYRSWSYPEPPRVIVEGIDPSPFTARRWLTIHGAARRIGASVLPDVWRDVEAHMERAVELHHTGQPALFTSWWRLAYSQSKGDERRPHERARRIYRVVVDVILAALAEGDLRAVAECRHTRKRHRLGSWVWRTQLAVPIVYGGVSLIHFKAHREGFPPAPRDDERSALVIPVDVWELSLKGDAFVLLISRASVERFLQRPEYQRLISAAPKQGPGRKRKRSLDEIEAWVVPLWVAGKVGPDMKSITIAIAEHFKARHGTANGWRLELGIKEGVAPGEHVRDTRKRK